MDAFNFKSEKQSTMSTYNLFTGIAKTLRLLELCLALLFLLWILTRLPVALRISVDFFRSPLFVFALSNAIIATLFAQSHLLFPSSFSSSADSAAPLDERLEYQNKQINETCTNDVDSCAVTDSCLRRNVYSRNQSVRNGMNGEEDNDNQTEKRKLRRSETEVRGILYPEDKLSNEEFQRTIDAFIAKQMRFLQEESC